MTIVGVRRSRRLSNQLERDELEIVDPVPEHPMPPPVKDGRSQLRGHSSRSSCEGLASGGPWWLECDAERELLCLEAAALGWISLLHQHQGFALLDRRADLPQAVLWGGEVGWCD